MGKCKEKAAAAKALRLSRTRGALLSGAVSRTASELMLLTARSILIAETANMNCSSMGSPSECMYMLLNEREKLPEAPRLSGAAVYGIAPAGLYYSGPREPYQDEEFSGYEQMLEETADMAALAGGSIPDCIRAVMLVHILHEIMSDKVVSAEALEIVARDAAEKCKEIFTDEAEKEHICRLEEMVRLAAELSSNDSSDPENLSCIRAAAEEAADLGSALYCCMRYFGDLNKTLEPFTGDGCISGYVKGEDKTAADKVAGIGKAAPGIEESADTAAGIAGVIMGAVTGYRSDGNTEPSAEYEADSTSYGESFFDGDGGADMSAEGLRRSLLEAADDIAEGPKAEGLRVTAYWAEKYLTGE